MTAKPEPETDEPDDEPGPADDDLEPDPDDDDQLEPDDTPVEPAAPSTESVLRERDKRLEAETKRHENALRKAYGDDFAELAVCPCCLSDGWIIPAPPGAFPPEQWEAVRIACGQEVGDEFKQADYAEACPTCDGWGKVATGSHVPDLGTPLCRDCNGQGWREKLHAVQAPPVWTAPSTSANSEVLALDWTRPRDQYGRPEGHPRFGIDPQFNGGVW